MRLRAQDTRGFSLIELLVSVTVLAIGLLAVASMQSVAVSNTAVSHRIMVANDLAKEAMEDIMAWDPARPELNSSVTNAVYASAELSGGGIFTITYTTTVNTPAAGTTRIDVTVTEVTTSHPITPVVLTAYARVV